MSSRSNFKSVRPAHKAALTDRWFNDNVENALPEKQALKTCL